MSTLPNPIFTPDEYLALERAAEYKSEYWDGQIWAMSGATYPHNLLAVETLVVLAEKLRSGNCRVLGSDMRVAIPSLRQYFYPDVMAHCGQPVFQDGVTDTLLNPILIVEVLSPSSEAYDRGRKWEKYQTIPSLHYYLLLAQDRVHGDLFSRSENGNWIFATASGVDGVLVLEKLGCTLHLGDLYDRVPLADRS